MIKKRIETTKTIFIVEALTIIIFSFVPIVESMKDLNMIDAANVKIIKNEFPKKNSVNNILISLSDSHHQHDFPLVICYLGLKITLSLCLMLYFLIRGLFILNQYLCAC